MHHLFFLIICLIWGSNFILMDRAASWFGAVDIGFFRLFGGGAIMGLLWWLSGNRLVAPRHWFHIGLVALFGNALPFAIQPFLISLGFGHSFFGGIVALVPLLTILLSIPMLGVWPTFRQALGVTGGLLGLMTLLWEGQQRGMSLTVLSLAIMVPFVYAVANTYIRWKLSEVPAIPLATSLFIVGALFLIPCLIFEEPLLQSGPTQSAATTSWAMAVASVSWLAIFGTGIAGYLFITLLHARGPLFAGMSSYPIPLIALAWGVFDNEPITGRQLVAIVFVLAMVGLVQFDGKRSRPMSENGSEKSLTPAPGKP
jgi:drug/metabolite transporter (DMT)-like permease